MEHYQEEITVFWFRRDLRLDDNAALYYALKQNKNILPIFIFDTDILNRLENKLDKRVDFIHQVILNLNEELRQIGSAILVKQGKPIEVFEALLQEYKLNSVYANRDYEPDAIARDQSVAALLKEHNVSFKLFKDQVIFEQSEIVKDDGSPYTVFTPFSKKWKAKLDEFYMKQYPCRKYFSNFAHHTFFPVPELSSLGFLKTEIHFVKPEIDETVIRKYAQTRDFPFIKGTSRLSLHLRFGTISIRYLSKIATLLSETWLNELIWRDFYMSILFHFPHVVHDAFKKKYDNIEWRNNLNEFEAWCAGKTGYPLVDAGMRELNTTGFMHNRVRMVVASFLVKHLLIDWRWGEAYFAEKLLDFDLAANNGGWQWAAGSGCDAAPYFRVFNPTEQTKKFDKDLKYIRKWVPEFDTFDYPQPIVEHKFARERALSVYKKGLQDF